LALIHWKAHTSSGWHGCRHAAGGRKMPSWNSPPLIATGSGEGRRTFRPKPPSVRPSRQPSIIELMLRARHGG
jgi:hypothetical protein